MKLITQHGSNKPLNDEMEVQEASPSAPLTVKNASKFPQRNF